MNYNKLPILDSCCKELVYFIDEQKLPIQYNPRLHKLEMCSASNTWVQELSYCPFCGFHWDNTLEEQWLEEVDKLGIEGDFLEILQRVPADLQTSKWWKSRLINK